MRIRIISGSLKGRFIQVRDAGPSFRPTLERTRQAVADAIMPSIAGSHAADLCAGSGAFGFEMLSRGAAAVEFVEVDRHRARQIALSAETFGVQERCRVTAVDVRTFLRRAPGAFDIVYFDPPYDDAGLAVCAADLRGLLADGGILLYEHRREKKERGAGPVCPVARTIVCGDSVVDVIDGRSCAAV